MNKVEIEEGVRNFLINEVFYDKALDANALQPTDTLVGLLDSLGIMRVVNFCEESFGIQIPDTDILPEHFETIRAIAELIAAQQK
ncbi:MAG: acyl carrier protein [Candidatus Binataceae bacterium]|jgi:acyl carrier protein